MIKQFYLTHTNDPAGTTTLDQSGAGSSGYEGVLHTLQNFRTGVSPSDAV